MRLIDAESPQNGIYVSDLVIEEMKKIPTVDVDRPTRSQFKRMAVQLGYEPVVYCKYCKYRHPESKRCDCDYWQTLFTTRDDDFCRYGEVLTNMNCEHVDGKSNLSLSF